MPTLRRPLLLLLLALLPGAGVLAAADFPQEHSDLKPDPAVLFGRLDNGLRYAVMANQQPKDKVSVRLLVESGSTLESEPQRGLAHFLEHLAFEGTTHYPPGTLVTQLQELGLSFGADTNAHTSFDETVYKLDLPDAKPATIATALTVMADYAGGMLLQQAQVDSERGVILAEMRDRNSPAFRLYQELYGVMYRGQLTGQRFPIGLKETIEKADAALLKAYFDDWYRPERMAITVVGACDPRAVAAQIRSAAGALAARTPAKAEPVSGELAIQELGVCYRREPEAEGISVGIMHITPRARPHDSTTQRREELLRGLAEGVLAHRFQVLIAKDATGPLLDAGLENYQWLGNFHAGALGTARPGQALVALATLEQEVRRFLEHGPTAAELAVAVAATRAAAEEAVAKAGSRTNAGLGEALYTGFHHDRVFLAPEDERALTLAALTGVTPLDVQSALRGAWAGGSLVVSITGPEDLGDGAEERIRAAWRASLATPVAAPASQQVATWGYGARPAPATDLVAGTISADLGIAYFGHAGMWTLTKATAFKPNEILVQLRLQYPPAPRQAGVAEFAERAFLAGGLGRHSAQELPDILAGSTVRIAPPRIEDDGVVFTATCLPGEFELCLQELNAYLTDPGWRSDGEATAKSAWLEELKALGTNLDAHVGRTFQALTVGGAPGRRQATLEEAQAVGFAQVRAWLEPILRTAPLTLSVVGDLEADGRVQALLRTGAYFSGPRSVEVVMTTPGEARRMAAGMPMPTGVTRIAVPGTVPRALILVAWPTADFYDIARTRRLGLLAQVFSERMRVRIRQELGDAYSPFAHRMASEVYRGEGYLMAEVGVAPEKVEEARATVLAIAQELVDKGVGTDLLAQVKPPVVKSLAAQRQQNQYWLGSVLSRAMTQPFRIDWATTMEADYGSITALDLSQLAKQYLVNAKALQVVGVCTGK